MEIRQEGDSSSVASAFGFSNESIQGGSLQTPERETTPDAPEGSATPAEVVEDTEKHEEPLSPDLISEDEKRMVIDTIERQLDQFDQGILSAEDLQKFFSDKPEVANIANKSKRVKERYRSFSEGTHPRLQINEDVSPVKEDESLPTTEKPLTLKDLDAYFSQKEGALFEKQLKAEKEKQFITFASERGIVDKEAEALQTTAKALADVHSEWTYDQALDAAYRAIQPAGKPKPVHVINGGGLREEQVHTNEESIDLSKTSWSMDAKSFGLS